MPRVYKMKNGQPSQREKIIEFITEHPNCTTRDVREAFAMLDNTACMALSRLRREGVIDSIKIEGEKRKMWALTDETPRRITVKEWTGHKRDAWHQLFYGVAA